MAILSKIDKLIESSEKSIKNGQCLSGIKYWTKKDRPELISSEIIHQSCIWRELNDIDWNNLPESIYLESSRKEWYED